MDSEIDENLERLLWKNPIQIASKILDAVALGNLKYQNMSLFGTKTLYAGRCTDGTWALGDDDSLYTCGKIIKVHDGPERNELKNVLSDACLEMFMPLGCVDLRYAKMILQEFFAYGNQIDLMKSRWTFERRNVFSSRSLQATCLKYGIDPWEFAVENDLMSFA